MKKVAFTLIFFCSCLFAKSGYVIYDVLADSVVTQQEQNVKLNVASNLKLFTSVVALEELGSDFKFITKFKVEGDTLFVKAGGDPILVMEELYIICLELKNLGADSIKFVVIDDMLYFPDGYEDLTQAVSDRAYYAPMSALALNYNTYQLDFVNGKLKVKTPGEYFLVEDNPQMKFGLVKTKPSHDRLLVEANFSSRYRRSIYKRVYNSTSHFFYTMCHYLDLPEIPKLERRNLSDKIFAKGNVHVHYSKPLKEILRLMNVYSSNFIAESIGCYLGKLKYQNPKLGKKVIEDFIEKNLGKKVKLEGCSGLGKNFLSAKTILNLLKYAWNKPFLRIDFFSGLPDLGKEGTLKSFGRGMKVKAKSGSLHNVCALSGLYLNDDNHLFLFSFVDNSSYEKAVSKRDIFLDEVLSNF